MTTQERAYLAGIIDGEGTITLSSAHGNETSSPKVSVANNSLQLMQWIKTKTGSGVLSQRGKREPQHGTQYVLDISNNAALNLLAELKQYLIIKKTHAELLLSRYKAVTPRNGRYTAEMSLQKKRLVEEIRLLNRISRKGT